MAANRFYDIFILITLVGLAVSFANASGIFNYKFSSMPDQQANFQVTDLQNYTQKGTIGTDDYFKTNSAQPSIGVDMIWSMISSFVYVYPLIVDKLHGNPLLGLFLQGIVTISQIGMIIQVLTRFGWGQVDN
jgi:hypothetical protein